jgi:hypothetical protein
MLTGPGKTYFESQERKTSWETGKKIAIMGDATIYDDSY